MKYTLFATKDNSEGQLNANIGASALTILLNAGEGANFPQPLSSTTSSGGTNVTLNKTGIGATGVVAGDFIENVTDGSHAFILAVNTDSVITTELQNGSDNTWQNGDTYRVKSFIATLNKRSSGVMTANEQVKIIARSGDTLTVDPAGRGYAGSTPQPFSADDYINLFVTSSILEELRKGLQDAARQSDLKASTIYVDSALNARLWKDPVVVATTVAGTLATSFENGDTVDGIVLATGNRILIKDQASPAENGIYVVAASGAPTRAVDFDTTSEVTGAAVSVIKGTSNQDTVWICTSDSPTIGVSNIVFSQVGASVTKASQGEAEAATNDNKFMTPLQTLNSIAYQGDVENGTLGDNIVSGDITGQTNLVYLKRSDMRWYKVTSDETTWFKELGLAIEVGTAGNRAKILRRGIVAGQSYSNINPTVSSSLTGNDINVGQSNANSAAAIILLDNSSGAETEISSGQISAKQVGAPAGQMLIYAVLAHPEYNANISTGDNQPACFKDTTNNVVRGAIIGYATIQQSSFSGSYQNLVFGWKDGSGSFANLVIPAGYICYMVVAKTGAVNGSNYYQIQSNSASKLLDQSTQTWSGTANGGNHSQTVVSRSPIGYSLKAYNGTAGSYNIIPTNRWSPVIGRVISSTEFYFDPQRGRISKPFTHSIVQLNTEYLECGKIDLGFCPSELKVMQARKIDATADLIHIRQGYLRADLYGQLPGTAQYNVGLASIPVASSTQSTDDAGNEIVSLNLWTPFATFPGSFNKRIYAWAFLGLGVNSSDNEQNFLRFARLENGVLVYSCYKSGANYISGGITGFASSRNTLICEAIS